MNKIDIENKTDSIIKTKIIEDTANKVLKDFNITNSFLEIIFINKDEISDLNTKHRSINKPTDVLSFPQPEVKEAAIRVLGSIAINLETVTEKQEDLGDVIKHGLLHLLGFDHEEDENLWQQAADRINCKL